MRSGQSREPGTQQRTSPGLICEVVVTAADHDRLARFALALLADGLCAGAHQVQTVRSHYRDGDAVYEEYDACVSLRTRVALVETILARTLEQFPDERASVIARPIIAAAPGYVEWVCAETAEAVTS